MKHIILYSKKYKTLSMILSIYEIMFRRRTNGTGTLYFQNYFEFSQTFTSILITLDVPARQLTLLSPSPMDKGPGMFPITE